MPFGKVSVKMAKRICFISKPMERPIFKETEIEFKYFSGFAITQKQKSIDSMHESIRLLNKNLNVLEISTKSKTPIGSALSAFNLKYLDGPSGCEYPVENIFQSSKVFENGGPFKDLLRVSPKDAKRDARLKSSGKLKYFEHNNIRWELEPKSIFYDWIYINALNRNMDLKKQIIQYNAFTDIEFNHKKSFNCQARSVAIFVSMSQNGLIEDLLSNEKKFKEIYPEITTICEPLGLPFS